MKKKKSVVFKIFSFLMVLCTTFVFVGCGLDPDEMKEMESEIEIYDPEDGESLIFDMYGTKVLYRPENYDFDGASNTDDYYGAYAYRIMEGLYQTYGLANAYGRASQFLGMNSSDFQDIAHNFYDSIRYSIDTTGTITSGDGAGEFVVGADYSKAWNWSFGYNVEDYKSVLELYKQEVKNNHVYAQFLSADEAKNYIVDETPDYTAAYLGASSVEASGSYSPFVKAMKYVIYCYGLDMEPNKITVTDSAEEPYYNVAIEGYSSVDNAVEDVAQLFKDVGAYVGVSERQKEKIQAYIKANVIGTDVIENDQLLSYPEVSATAGADGVSYTFSGTPSTISGIRKYDIAVDNIVNLVCSDVKIGDQDEDGSGNVDDKFLASEIMEYAGNTFVIAGDENFQKVSGEGSKYYIQPQEYQSAVLMLKDQTTIEGLYIALKYDADDDGTEEGKYNKEKYLDIIVELNYYNHDENKVYTIGSEEARVYDGPFDVSQSGLGMYEDFGNVYFYNFENDCKDSGIKKHLDKDGNLTIGEFATGIGNNALMTDVGLAGGYVLPPYISNNPLVFTGTNPVRRYYEFLEPTPEEEATLNGRTYVSGRLNGNKFSSSDGSDYLEITYKVLKDSKTDRNKNYKFYTGISFIY